MWLAETARHFCAVRLLYSYLVTRAYNTPSNYGVYTEMADSNAGGENADRSPASHVHVLAACSSIGHGQNFLGMLTIVLQVIGEVRLARIERHYTETGETSPGLGSPWL